MFSRGKLDSRIEIEIGNFHSNFGRGNYILILIPERNENILIFQNSIPTLHWYWNSILILISVINRIYWGIWPFRFHLWFRTHLFRLWLQLRTKHALTWWGWIHPFSSVIFNPWFVYAVSANFVTREWFWTTFLPKSLLQVFMPYNQNEESFTWIWKSQVTPRLCLVVSNYTWNVVLEICWESLDWLIRFLCLDKYISCIGNWKNNVERQIIYY